MLQRRIRLLPACTIGAAAAMLAAPTMPGLARADGGTAVPLALAAAPAEAPQAIVHEALAATAEELSTIGPPESPATPAETSSPTDVSAQSAEVPVAEPASEPDPAPEDAIHADTTPVEHDTALDTPPTASAPVEPVEVLPSPEHEPTTTEQSPAPTAPAARDQTQANINVSVRIGSPGDNGSVTQINAVGDPAAGRDPAAGQVAESDRPTRDAATAETDGAWYWQWDCLELGSLGSISPFGSVGSSTPRSWTWIWNCGDKLAQYQDESSPGYRQINTNVSIRISSPGDDGSVTQVNVGAGVRIPLSTPLPPRLPTEPPLDSVPTVPAAALELDGTFELPTTPVMAGGITLAPPASASADSTIPPESVTEASPAPRTDALGRMNAATRPPFSAGLRAWSPTAPSIDQRPAQDVSALPGREPPATSASRSPVAAPGGAVSRPASEIAPEQRAAPRWRPVPPERSAPAPLSTASAAASAGGGGSGTGVPFLLALPFVVALLDLARRVALERVTWPPGQRRRAPERPG